jgi:hypothetical protein
MTDMPAAAGSGRAPGRAEPGLIHRHDLMAALNRAAQKRVTARGLPRIAGPRNGICVQAETPLVRSSQVSGSVVQWGRLRGGIGPTLA